MSSLKKARNPKRLQDARKTVEASRQSRILEINHKVIKNLSDEWGETLDAHWYRVYSREPSMYLQVWSTGT